MKAGVVTVNNSLQIARTMENPRNALTPRDNEDIELHKESKEVDLVDMFVDKVGSSGSASGSPPALPAEGGGGGRGTKPTSESCRDQGAAHPPRPTATVQFPRGSNSNRSTSSSQRPSKQETSFFKQTEEQHQPQQSWPQPASFDSRHMSPTKRHSSETNNTQLETISGGMGAEHGGVKVPQHQSPVQYRMLEEIDQEQILFEKRLSEGISVRKINQHGKANLRYVRWIFVDDSEGDRKSTRSCSSRSGGSWARGMGDARKADAKKSSNTTLIRGSTASVDKKNKALVWGKKKDVMITLDRFIAVKKGKTTDRARRSSAPSSRVLSLVTDDADLNLDIDTPTPADRDKFAKAFALFLDVPCYDEAPDAAATASSSTELKPNEAAKSSRPLEAPQTPVEVKEGGFYPPPLPPSPLVRQGSDSRNGHIGSIQSSQMSSTNRDSSQGHIVSVVDGKDDLNDVESASDVSSITGHGYDQEIVEELHHALNEMRAELEESRAEAARAVKVAEQAIQSAERSNSAEWQNTVTHKAAEAAALAQKRCAEAMAKQRLAEEKLEGERRTAAFWRKQAEVAEEEAGVLQTRAAAAEVQRAAMEAQIESERRTTAAQLEALRSRLNASTGDHKDSLDNVMMRNRILEMELDRARREIHSSAQKDLEAEAEVAKKKGLRKSLSAVTRRKGFGKTPSPQRLLEAGTPSSSSTEFESKPTLQLDGASSEQVIKLHAEALQVREQFEMLRRATSDELQQLPADSKKWASQVSEALQTSQRETEFLRQRLAFEGASRRKLLHEVQDLRGRVRVYCLPRPLFKPGANPLVTLASQETVMFHRDRIAENADSTSPMSFEFDRVFHPSSSQHDVYGEMEEVCMGVLDGYNICVMGYGQSGSGKTHWLLGDVISPENRVEITNHGIQLRAMAQLFAIAEHRSERFTDVFTLTIVEVHNERLSDMLAGTNAGESRGEVVKAQEKSSRRSKSQRSLEDDGSSSKQTKLEIRTDVHGETVVQGLVSVEVKSFDDVYSIWADCLGLRRARLAEQGIEVSQYESECHVIATLKVRSTNIATGSGSIGKIQFVDLAACDLIPRRLSSSSKPSSPQQGVTTPIVGDDSDWQFANRSIETLSEVVAARSQFTRSVPYRNSTLTHLLRDSLEHDTKVILLACVMSDPEYAQETATTLRFASRMGRIVIGKATKHTLSPP